MGESKQHKMLKNETKELSIEEFSLWQLRKRFEWFKLEGLPCSDKELFSRNVGVGEAS